MTERATQRAIRVLRPGPPANKVTVWEILTPLSFEINDTIFVQIAGSYDKLQQMQYRLTNERTISATTLGSAIEQNTASKTTAISCWMIADVDESREIASKTMTISGISSRIKRLMRYQNLERYIIE